MNEVKKVKLQSILMKVMMAFIILCFLALVAGVFYIVLRPKSTLVETDKEIVKAETIENSKIKFPANGNLLDPSDEKVELIGTLEHNDYYARSAIDSTGGKNGDYKAASEIEGSDPTNKVYESTWTDNENNSNIVSNSFASQFEEYNIDYKKKKVDSEIYFNSRTNWNTHYAINSVEGMEQGIDLDITFNNYTNFYAYHQADGKYVGEYYISFNADKDINELAANTNHSFRVPIVYNDINNSNGKFEFTGEFTDLGDEEYGDINSTDKITADGKTFNDLRWTTNWVNE